MSAPRSHQSPATETGIYVAADFPPGTLLANRFRIVSLVGVGGMGVVYRASDEALGITVAVKLLRPELVSRPDSFERFRQELLLARQVSSPHVLRIHDIASHEGRWLISMDLVDGEPLDRLLERRGPLAEEEAIRIARQIAEGLAAAHSREVIHRDIKPSNILLDASGHAWITDFGVARSLGSSGMTQSGLVVGTPDYLSPEQARGDRIDGRSDLYSLGLLLYEMLAGSPPFTGGTAMETLTRRLVSPPPSLASRRKGLSKWVLLLVDRLLRPNPAHRFKNAREVVEAIERRHVPRDYRAIGRRTAGMAATISAALLAWWGWQTLPTAPATPPPERVLVLAQTDAGGAQDAALLGAAEHLRQALDAHPRLAVIDGERTRQAINQLGLADGRAPDLETVRGILPARWAIAIEARRDGADGGLVLAATLRGPQGEVRRLEAPGAEFSAASQRLFSDIAHTLEGDATFPPDLIPNVEPALAAYGSALRLRREGRLVEAHAQLVEATSAAPGYAAAWLARADLEWVLSDLAEAAKSVAAGTATAPPAFIGEELTLFSASLAGHAEEVIASLRRQVEIEREDLYATLRLAQWHGNVGNATEARALLERIVARDPEEARAWFLLGKLAILGGDVRRAVDEHLLRALVLFKRSRNIYGEAETSNAMGIAYARLGQTADAEEQYRRALALRRSMGYPAGVTSSLRNLAQIAVVRGDLDSAQGHLTEARALAQAMTDPANLAAIDNELGVLAEERGDYSAALEFYRQSLRGRQLAQDDYGSAEVLNNLGFAQYQLGDYDSAQAFWYQAQSIFGEIDDVAGQIRTIQNLGLLAIARGRWTQAAEVLGDSLSRAETHQLAEEAAVSLRNLAELALWRGRLGEADDYLRRAERLFGEREDQRGLIDVGLQRIRMALLLGNAAGAEALIRELRPQLPGASREQRAIAELHAARTARLQSDRAGLERAIDAAGPLARAAGIRGLVLTSELLDPRRGATQQKTTVAALKSIDNVPLQLQFHGEAMLRMIESRDWAEAARLYRDALALLASSGVYAEAYRLHAYGHLALTQLQDNQAAARARELGATAYREFTDSLPKSQRVELEADPVVAVLVGSGT